MSKIFAGGPLDRAAMLWSPERCRLHLLGRMLFDLDSLASGAETNLDREPDLWRGFAERLFRITDREPRAKSPTSGRVLEIQARDGGQAGRQGLVNFLLDDASLDLATRTQLFKLPVVKTWRTSGVQAYEILRALWGDLETVPGGVVPVSPDFERAVLEALRFDAEIVEVCQNPLVLP